MEFLMFFGLAVAGVFIHIANKLRDEVTKNHDKTFLETFALFQWRKHVFFGLVAVVISAVVVAIREDIQNIYPVTKITAIILGYSADSIFKNIISTDLSNGKE